MYKHGIDNVEKADAILSGKRIGLITNHTGFNSKFVRTIDVLKERYNLVKLYAPEHGLHGVLQAGEEIDNMIDEKSGLPVLSLFKEGSSPDFSGIDIIAYDIQDIGLRFFTYISVLALAMQECAKIGIPLVIFDRYNPLGLNSISGTMLKKEFSSFVGMYETPSRYALTVGEYAKYINTEEGIGCQLEIIPCSDLSRQDDFYSLKTPWIPPSPNCPTIETAHAYIGTVVFEGTNVSEGRGTTKPFEFIGAPWIDENELAFIMNSHNLKGVLFRPIQFSPTFSKHKGECCKGVQIHITDRKEFDSFYCGMLLLDTIRKNYKEFKTINFLCELLGTDEFTADDFDLEDFISKHNQKIQEFNKKAKKHHIYN